MTYDDLNDKLIILSKLKNMFTYFSRKEKEKY